MLHPRSTPASARTAPRARALATSLQLALCATLSASCVINTSSPGVFLATDPPGARVFVDGRDSGFATPCAISLDKTSEHEVAFLLNGYAVARRSLFPNTIWQVVPWTDGDIGTDVWRFPIFLTFRGLFFPFRENDNLAPPRVYVPLEVATEE